jgi:ubiquinone/menaquinone biosynthesis C-methylase UbiE
LPAEADGGLHPAAAGGFDAAAQAYERGRPSYPADAVSFLVRALGIAADATVLDVGAGTGKLTRLLDPTGARLIAIEPVASMRGILALRAPRAMAVAALAERLPLRAACVDAIVVAQAFHWFDGPAALREFHRVLQAGGGVGLIFNRRRTDDELTTALAAIFEPHRRGVPTHRNDAWRLAFEATDGFQPLRRQSFEHAHEQRVRDVVDRVTSISFIATLPSDERTRVADDVRRAVIERAGGEEGVVRLPYGTDVFWTRRR